MRLLYHGGKLLGSPRASVPWNTMSTVPAAPAIAQGITFVFAGSPLTCSGVDQLVPALEETVRETLLLAVSTQTTYTLPAWSVVRDAKRFPIEPPGLAGVLVEL